ncbi:MAG: tetratricopeptide repeat protein [Firmicutes bacterium]|nr:tetratricopeptide repeat protein [Bacillota bacterium]
MKALNFLSLVLIIFVVLLLYNYSCVAKQEISNSEIYNLKGYILLKEGNYKKSIQYFQLAIEKNTHSAIYYNNLGCAYYNIGEYKKAVEDFKLAINLDKNYIKAYYNLSASYFWLGRYFSAIKYYLRAKNIDEDYVNQRLDFDQLEKTIEIKMENNPDDKDLKRLYKNLKKYNDK